MNHVQIFDATAIIAFLSDMNYPDGLLKLSRYYRMIIPKGVEDEITKSPGKEMLQDLIKQRVIQVVKVDQTKVEQILNEYPQLHRGECEAISLMQAYVGVQSCIISDDLQARKIFKTLNFKGTERLLDIMKEKGIIDNKTYDAKYHLLQRSAFYTRERS